MTEGGFEVERLELRDVPANVALARGAGWKDVESEWRVLHAAAEVRGVRDGARLVAQGALGDYGNSAVLAKMVVAPELQRRGLGARLLDGFLASADARGIPVGLCATEQGRPLYASRGFEVSGKLAILFGQAEPGTAADPAVVPLRDVEVAIALDRSISGCDRAAMLRARYHEAAVKLELADGRGFGLATLQGEQALVGPVLAETEPEARRLFSALLAAVARPARVDVPLEHDELRGWLGRLGLREVSVRVEMARGAPRMPWQVARRFALATQAWG